MQQRIQANSLPSSALRAEEETLDLLPEQFVPGKWDVICQRGKECYDHVGNRRFRMIIDSHLGTYMEVMNRRQKTRIVTTIVKNIRAAAEQSGGGFVRKDLLTRRWFKVSDKLAREKVGQALRDAIKTRRSGGSQSKIAKSNAKKSLASQGLATMVDEQSVRLPFSASQVQGILALNAASVAPKALNTATSKGEALPANPAFSQQMVAELEPTPIRGQSLSFPGLFDRSSMAHQRSETSASHLLRLFDEGAAVKHTIEAGAVQAAAAAAATQSRRLSLGQMTFHPIADQATPVMSLSNDFRFF